MKIAIVSDIHGNLEALESVGACWDALWVLGDLVNYGPNPAEVVEFVRRNASLVVCGNHDLAVGAGAGPQCSPAFAEMARAMQAYTSRRLTAEQKEYLRSLPRTASCTVDGEKFFLCHAAPSSPLYKYAPADLAFWAGEAAAVDASVLLVGHTHLPMLLELGRQRVVNPGSVGQPKHGVAEARYAVWEDGAMRLRSSRYPVEQTVRKISDLPIEVPIRERLMEVLRTGRPPSSPRL